jgi:hypothetical protein
MLRPRITIPLFAVLAVCLLSARNYAAPLLSGATIPAPGEPDPTGGVVQPGTGVAVAFVSPSGPGSFSGTLTTTVISGDPSNPLGGLTFTYRLTNNPGSFAALERMTNLDFNGFLIDASFQIPAAGVVPSLVDRDASGSSDGWSFNPLGLGAINPGTASALLVIQTNAPAFQQINANVLDGSIAVVSSFGPRIIPEPASMAIAGLWILALRRRRA